ncbi:TPA: hypothetical protein JRS25_004136 [Escherichia coli]|nr:hypothetical protein [Escherichia coli]
MIITDKDSEDFNSYASEDDLVKFANDRGIKFDNSKASSSLINAMDYLSTLTYAGTKKSLTQPLDFPRVGLRGDSSAFNGEIPKRIITAQCRIAIEFSDSSSGAFITGSPEIIEERIEGAITTKYAQGTNDGQIKFPWLNALLGDLVVSNDGFMRVSR